MQLHQISETLRRSPGTFPRFVLPDGGFIPLHAHVTEVGHAVNNFIDCGGVTGRKETVLLQTHVGPDVAHRLTSERLAKILELGRPLLPHDRLSVEVEYDCCVVAQYPIFETKRTGEFIDFFLAKEQTQCLARARAENESASACCDTAACC